jgi:hypothetical protein
LKKAGDSSMDSHEISLGGEEFAQSYPSSRRRTLHILRIYGASNPSTLIC